MKSLRVAAALWALCSAPVASAATITVQASDGPGEGFNDPTPFTPIGGNPATTLGQARLRVLEEAARIWGQLIESPVTIKIEARFDPQTCTATSGALGGAGPTLAVRGFPGSRDADTLYPSALADALLGTDIAEQSTQTAGLPDIRAIFNSNVDSDPVCLGGRKFYYGFDHQLDRDGNGTRDYASDLLRVMLHELAHGLGFSSIVNLATGEGVRGSDSVERVSIFDQFVYDESTTQGWSQMTAAERLQSSRNSGRLAWNGARANERVSRLASGVTPNRRLRLYAPAAGSTTGGPVSHWDVAVAPDLLMEPFESAVGSSTVDFTTCALADLGWTIAARRCPDQANRVPVATPQSVATTEDTSRRITLAGTDGDSDGLRYSVVTSPTQGVLSGTAPELTYTPNTNVNGTDSFTYSASDGLDSSAVATVTISIAPVNDPPVATARAASATSGQATSIALQGSDPDGDPLTFEVTGTPANGRVSLAAATATYTSNTGFAGTDSFTFRVSDGVVASATAIVTIEVSAAPTIPVGSSGGGGGGGGGSTDAWLVGLLGAWLARRVARRDPRLTP